MNLTKHVRVRRLSTALAALGLLSAGMSVVLGGAAAASTTTDGPGSPSTPGLYAWNSSAPQYTDLHFHTKVTLDPGPKANVFWAHQFKNSVSGSGYIGFQTVTNKANTGKLVLFSVWGATGCQVGSAKYGSYCVGNTDGASGRSVRIWYPWKAGVNYQLTVRQSATPGWWAGYIYDPTTKTNTRIGLLQFGGTTTGKVSPRGDFVEYFNWNNPKATCGQQLNSAAIYAPVTGMNGLTAVAPVKYRSTSHSKTCTYADHSSVLPDGSASLVATPRP